MTAAGRSSPQKAIRQQPWCSHCGYAAPPASAEAAGQKTAKNFDSGNENDPPTGSFSLGGTETASLVPTKRVRQPPSP